jgi:rhodanese-related sulfurtransferase
MDLSANEIEVVPLKPAELATWMASATPPVLIDVREKEELTGPLGHIAGIVHIPIASLSHRLGELEQHRNNMIVTVCRSGSRAYTAAQILTAAGFKQVVVLDGGMQAWRENVAG